MNANTPTTVTDKNAKEDDKDEKQAIVDQGVKEQPKEEQPAQENAPNDEQETPDDEEEKQPVAKKEEPVAKEEEQPIVKKEETKKEQETEEKKKEENKKEEETPQIKQANLDDDDDDDDFDQTSITDILSSYGLFVVAAFASVTVMGVFAFMFVSKRRVVRSGKVRYQPVSTFEDEEANEPVDLEI